MGAGFWAGFGGELSSRIKERESFVREQTQRRQDYLRTVGVPAIQKRKAEMEADVGKIKSAVALGLKEDVANAAYQAGHLDIVMDDILKATDTTGAVNHFNSIQQFAEEVGKTAEDPFEVVKKVWGAVAETDADVGTEDGRNQSFFEAVFAWNPEAAIDQGVMKSSLKGYTEKDAAEALGGGVRRVTTPEGYRYESLPASVRTGKEKVTLAQIFSYEKNLTVQIANATKTAFEYVGTDNNVVIDKEAKNAALIMGSANKSAEAMSDRINRGYNEVDVYRVVMQAKDHFLRSDPPNFEGFNAYMDEWIKSEEAPPLIDFENTNTDETAPEKAPPPNSGKPSVTPFAPEIDTEGEQ